MCYPQNLPAPVDSGSNTTLIHNRCIPPGATATVIACKTGQTLAGKLVRLLQEIILPEFSCSSRVDYLDAYIFEGICNYDIIFGRAFPCLINMTQDFAKGSMTAF
jgi:hypothetical protein